jgi:hypothetical protein
MKIAILSTRKGSTLPKALFAAITLFMAVLSAPFYASGQNGPQQCVPAALNVYASQSSVAVGEEFDLFVSITNTSPSTIHNFAISIGYFDDSINPQELPTTSMLQNFQVVDTHHPTGRVYTNFSYNSEVETRINSLEWFANEPLFYEWLHPGETATLRLRLRAIGVPGVLQIPIQLQLNNQYELGCDYSASTSVTITEGSLPEPFLIQKTLMGNDLYDCVRMGDELIALWQITNTSEQGRWIRFRDVVPGYVFDGMYQQIPRSVFLASLSGISSESDVLNITANGEFAILQSNAIYLPANTSLLYFNYFDISGYAAPSSLTSTVYVWETDYLGAPEMPPVDAYSFTNTPIPVCSPILTKTAVGDYCTVREGTELTYQVDIDRIILGSVYAYSIMEDLHPAGTSYLPTGDPNFAGPLYEYYVAQQRTLWSFETFQNANQVPLEYDGDNPLFMDKMKLVYRLDADEDPSGSVVNRFNIRSGSTNRTGSGDPNKITADEPLQRKPGDNLRPFDGAAKLANGNSFDQILFRYDEALNVASSEHEMQSVCYFIEGYKFNDLNGNGVRDLGEPGVQSWMIVAQSSEGVYTAVTDENGYYRMEGLPQAVWQVRESYQLGWIQSAPGGEGFYNVQLGSQVRSARLDFGNWKPSSISGTKYTDTDGSGRRDSGEPAVEGVRIELRDLTGAVVQHTHTDADGHYEFTGVAPGHYAVFEDGNTSTRQSQPGPQEGGFHYVVTKSGDNYPYRDFGNYTPVDIAGKVIEVQGKLAEHDPTVRDARQLMVQLLRMGPNASDEPSKVASEAIVLEIDEYGSFGIDNLQPGDWQVSVLLAEYWNAASENPVDVFVPSGGSASVGFEVVFDRLAAPEVTTSSITGSVFRNTTADHLYNKATDVMVTGQSVRLLGASDRGAVVERTVTTGNDGSFRFEDLPAGEYVVSLSSVADTLRQGWPWAHGHRVILGEDEHVGATFAAQESSNPPMIVDADLPWKFDAAAAYANLATRIDDNGDGRADRRNFFSGPAVLARTSVRGVSPMAISHTVLQMAGTDSLGRTILANSPAGGSVATISPSAPTDGHWRQGLDLVFDLEGTAWYGPTATNASNVPAVVVHADVTHWLSLYKAAEFVAAAGNAPVIRDPMGTAVATVLSASYVLTPGVDFGLTPTRFDADDDGDDDGGTGSGGGSIGTNDGEDRADVPRDFALGSAYPNPFNPSTVVPFELAAAGQVRLAVYDVTGRQVAVLVNTTMSAGRHSVAWDAAGLPSGVYMVRLTAGGKVMTGKATLLK